MYSTGWEELIWQKDMQLDAPTSKWGYADDVVVDLFGDEVEALGRAEQPFLAGLLTLSSMSRSRCRSQNSMTSC